VKQEKAKRRRAAEKTEGKERLAIKKSGERLAGAVMAGVPSLRIISPHNILVLKD
jgi:hypothetical protein